MIYSKQALQALWKSDIRSRVAAAAGALLTTGIIMYPERGQDEKINEKTIQNRLSISQATALDGIIQPIFIPLHTTSCDFLRGPNFSRLARSRTIRRMEKTSTKATLRSRYKVQWKNPLGEGGFGAVYLAIDKGTKEPVAVKQIGKSFTDDTSFQREMNAFLHIRHKGGHPNICGLRENFEEGDNYFLVLDLVSGGEMFEHLIHNGAYSEADAARLFREVGSAIAFLHGIDLVHGDLKPENLMLSSKNPMDAVIEVVDFGCAQIIDDKSPFYEASTKISATTPGYSPPEMIDNSTKLTHLDPSMDMFALGVILYVMLCGMHPFDPEGTATDEQLNKRVLERKLPPLRTSPYSAHLSRSAIDLIEKLMNPDPQCRLTAQQMLDHPWVRGETATKGKIQGSDERLKKYRKYRSRLEAKVFRNMIELSDDLGTPDVHRKTSLIERSFRTLDPDNKGYITTKELKQLSPDTSKDEQNDDDSRLSLAGFSDLLSDNMKNRYFPTGHVIYREGDKGRNMYFINSGRVEVSTKDGFTSPREAGDFFGEGALLSKNGRRSATIKCITPVHAIEISKEYFDKYLADGYDTRLTLRERDKTRKRNRAKTILASTKNMEEQIFRKGGLIYEQGQKGDGVCIIESGEVNVTIDDHVVFSVGPGELCGEHAVIFNKPRNTSAKCVSDKCVVHILKADDFRKIVNESASLRESLKDITHRREFQKALVFTTRKAFPQTEAELREAFDEADYNRSGKIDLSDITLMLKQMDTTVTSKEIKEILNSLDLDESGAVNWDEFKRVFGMSASKQM